MKKKLLAAVLAAAMVASTGCVVMAADGDTDYDVENREYKDVTITLHTRWDAAKTTTATINCSTKQTNNVL